MILLNSPQWASWWLQRCSTPAPQPHCGERQRGSESVAKPELGQQSSLTSGSVFSLLPILLSHWRCCCCCHVTGWSQEFLDYLPSCTAAAVDRGGLPGLDRVSHPAGIGSRCELQILELEDSAARLLLNLQTFNLQTWLQIEDLAVETLFGSKRWLRTFSDDQQSRDSEGENTDQRSEPGLERVKGQDQTVMMQFVHVVVSRQYCIFIIL